VLNDKKMPQVTELEKGAPTVQDGSDNSDSDSDSVPELEDAGTGGQSQVAAAAGLPEELVSKAKQSRGEKKSQKNHVKIGIETSNWCESSNNQEISQHSLCHQQA